MNRRLVIALLVVAVFIPLASAQTAVSFVTATGQAGAVGVSPSRSIISFGQAPPAHRFFPQPILLGSPFFYPDYNREPMVMQTPPPQVVVVRVPPAAAEVPEESRPEPVLIEWQGDRYVRMSRLEPSAHPDYAEPVVTGAATKREKMRPELPAILVFRDGHREEVREYAIADGVLYARGDYWVDGYWNKKIPFSALDLPATVATNRDSGVPFMLPSGPNVVVTRP